ncbi:HEAT repeat domain-containing protein [Actinoplanes sp. M2I2]|uniref:HEAT repeat domain-containing protein n=1 Tax=Actinoplanes sp. M2I2 TaxID=1734444 RepID=UPI002021163E|nr:HEAT repeat domain-containing protein [Actinoplanes sp. M2I2]
MSGPEPDYAALLAALLTPYGHPVARRERERALTLLMRDHAGRARSELLEAVRSRPASPQVPGILEVLPFFGGDEQVPVLESLLAGEDPDIAGYAGTALGRLPGPAAETALRQALASPSARVAAAAADGAGVRADTGLCEPLRARLADSDPELRYHVVHALLALGCLDRAQRESLAATEPDPGVRDLLGW